MARLPFTPTIEGLPAATPFVGPEALERRIGAPFRARIGANESAFGMAPGAARAIADEIARSAWYGDPEAFELRQRIAGLHGTRIGNIVVGAGIDELLGVLVRLVVTPGTPVVTSLGAYPTFNYHVAGCGGRLVTVPYRDDMENLEGLLAAVKREQAPLVYLANPDNPMGTAHPAAEVEAFIAALPEECICVLDEAYVEFAAGDTVPRLDIDDPRVVRMRTFSKAHGMAGLRIGYAIAHTDMAGGFDKIRNHFGVNRLAQCAALASLDDPAFIESVVARVAEGRRDYEALAAGLGLATVPSHTNFLAIDLGDSGRARAMLAALQAEGVFIRMPGVAPLDRCIRVTVGDAPERAIFAETFTHLVRAGA